MKRILLWFWLLTKRLLKKPTFLAILILVPLLSFGYQAMTQESSGILTIVLAQEGNDPTASAIIDDLLKQDTVFRYQVCHSAEEAALLVQTGKADAAWVFPEDLQQHMDDFLKDPKEKEGFIQVFQREQNTPLMLSRERLAGAMYHYLSQRYYLQYLVIWCVCKRIVWEYRIRDSIDFFNREIFRNSCIFCRFFKTVWVTGCNIW